MCSGGDPQAGLLSPSMGDPDLNARHCKKSYSQLKRTALLAGGTGKFGFRIARVMTYRPGLKVRVLVQPDSVSDTDVANLRWGSILAPSAKVTPVATS